MTSGRAYRQTLSKAACAALLALAALWTALHVNWQAPGEAFLLPAPKAESRALERMPVALPEGEIAVNRASADELCALTGIGAVLAEAIIAERESGGPFYFPEDLLDVKGIGEKKLAGFWAQISMD